MSKILIVDDEIQIRSLLARMLELEGYEVCQAGDCKAAVKQLEVQSPDVVLCDVFLPDGNGVDLVLNIKKQAPNVEVILLTAHGNIPDGVQAIKNGAFDYITKGDDNNKIIPLISRAAEKECPVGKTGEESRADVFVRFYFRRIESAERGYLFGTEGVCHGCSGITYRRDRDRKRGFCSGYPL